MFEAGLVYQKEVSLQDHCCFTLLNRFEDFFAVTGTRIVINYEILYCTPSRKPNHHSGQTHSFIPDISIAPLQVHYYSDALPTTA